MSKHKNIFLECMYEKFGRETTCIAVVEYAAEHDISILFKFNEISKLCKIIADTKKKLDARKHDVDWERGING